MAARIWRKLLFAGHPFSILGNSIHLTLPRWKDDGRPGARYLWIPNLYKSRQLASDSRVSSLLRILLTSSFLQGFVRMPHRLFQALFHWFVDRFGVAGLLTFCLLSRITLPWFGD